METRKTLLTLALLFAAFGMSFAYTTQIHAPAVLQNEDLGTLTSMKLNLTAGNGAVSIVGPQNVGSSTLQSAQQAVLAATSYLNVNATRYNFTYSIDNSVNVSGPSGGLALSLLAVYALRHEQLYNNFSVTGTITGNGAVGEIGGITDKAQAAKQGGMNYILVPEAQNGSSEDFLYYTAQQLYGIPVVEVSDLQQAVPYANATARPAITPLAINLTQDYNVASISASRLNCSDCNMSYFSQLSNYTFSFVGNEIDAISQNFSSAREQMLSGLAQYANISSKGYLYAGADLAFLEYSDAYALAHKGYFNVPSALGLATNVSDSCALVSPPQLTKANYEYIYGGELRYSLAMANLQDAIQSIKNSQTTDDIVAAIGMIAESQAWCGAARDMYGIASEIGGTPVRESASMKTAAQQELKIADQYPGVYLSAALLSYNNSDYGAALYGVAYAETFGRGGPSNYSEAAQAQISGIAINSTNGIWPTEFSDSALFYLQEAKLSKNASAIAGYVSSAYALAALSSRLSTINTYLLGNLENVTSASANQTATGLAQEVQGLAQEVHGLTQEVGAMHTVMDYLTVIVVVVLFVLLLMFSKTLKLLRMQGKRQGARRNSGRSEPS